MKASELEELLKSMFGGKIMSHNQNIMLQRKWFKRVGIFLGFIIVLWAIWQIWLDPYRGTVKILESSESLDALLTSEEAIKDMDFIVKGLLERHPACIKGLPKAVQDTYEQERVIISKSDRVSVLSLWQSSARILSALEDGHTAVKAYYKDVSYLPFSFSLHDNNLICLGGEYSGYIISEIGGVQVSELNERFLEQFSYELEAYARYSFAKNINRSDYLEFVGVKTAQDVEILMNQVDGEGVIRKTFPLKSGNLDRMEIDEPFVDFKIDKGNNVGIFTLRQCIYDEKYRSTLKSFFESVGKNGIQNVIVDLRGNPGGNSMVGNEFLRYLPVKEYKTGNTDVRFGPIIWHNKPQLVENQQTEPTFHGNVYALTSTDSFSSAVDFATLLSDNDFGTVVGQIPGNMPSSYGDILIFQTPHARLAFTISYKYFVRPDAEKSELPLIPNIETSDDALETTIEMIRHNS